MSEAYDGGTEGSAMREAVRRARDRLKTMPLADKLDLMVKAGLLTREQAAAALAKKANDD